jgi:AAA+ ATPase superfamily predicted ATPase
MKRIEFHDREKEMNEFMNILNSEPSLITFVYGPINSGKTTLINHLIEQLPEEYTPFYINLRGRFITGYEDFLNVLFEIDESGATNNVGEYATSILKDLKILSGIPIPINLFEQIFEKKAKSKDMFKYIERFFVEMPTERVPVMIIDELQVIGDMEINGHLIYKLFNFFVRLTKELHLAHVFVITSDSLFIEQVYSEAVLSGRCRYLLVDDFDRETTAAFLETQGFTADEKRVAWEHCGGKPVCLVELINYEKREEKLREMLRIRRGQIDQRIGVLKDVRKKILFEGDEIEITYNDVMKTLKRFSENESYEYVRITPDMTYLVKENILFADPANRIIKPQSRLDLLAIREILRRGD